jgi:hypothetical protein
MCDSGRVERGGPVSYSSGSRRDLIGRSRKRRFPGSGERVRRVIPCCILVAHGIFNKQWQLNKESSLLETGILHRRHLYPHTEDMLHGQ